MSTNQNHLSLYRYLAAVGSLNRWFYATFIVFAGWYTYLRALGDKSYDSQYVFLFLFPLVAGTGLLTSARRGELDLLFGAGKTRHGVWRAALFWGPGIAAAMAVVIFQLSGHGDVETSLRLLALLLFTGGISYCAGMVETRYFAGAVWLLARIIYFMWPSGFSTVLRIEKGIDIPAHGTLALAVLCIPESLLYPSMPVLYVIVSAIVGIAALASSYVWFGRADFGGHRG